MTTIVFPGQGSQNVGMGRDFNDNFEIAKLAYEEIEDHSQINLRKIIFENEGKKLDLTQYFRLQHQHTGNYLLNFPSYLKKH